MHFCQKMVSGIRIICNAACFSQPFNMLQARHFEFAPLSSWLPSAAQPLLISGPCSAESREQVLAIARALAQTGMVSAFRAGIWKPRTRPGAFEGQGLHALEWLQEVRERYAFPLAVEVATTSHVEACLKAGIDIIWIGARTSVNPFSVQEIAESLRGIDTPVMIKNPLNPDPALWAGVIERFYLSGVRRIAAIHRGFNTFEKTRYRNQPIWQIPIELKSIFPGLPLLCDPSHIAGQRQWIPEIAQQALDLDMDGLMIESHCHPEQALTDPAQQLTPDELTRLMKKLRISDAAEDRPMRELQKLRRAIDDYDHQMLQILAKRMDTVRDIAIWKKNQQITILQIKRWTDIMQDRIQAGSRLNLDKTFLHDILCLIHQQSIEIQSQIIHKSNHQADDEKATQ